MEAFRNSCLDIHNKEKEQGIGPLKPKACPLALQKAALESRVLKKKHQPRYCPIKPLPLTTSTRKLALSFGISKLGKAEEEP